MLNIQVFKYHFCFKWNLLLVEEKYLRADDVDQNAYIKHSDLDLHHWQKLSKVALAYTELNKGIIQYLRIILLF